MTDHRSPEERRTHPRLSLKVPIKYHIETSRKVLKKVQDMKDGTRHGFTLDISLGGMNVVLDDSLKVGDVIRFEIYLLHKRDRVTVYSEVKWVGPKSAGLYFLMMRPEESTALKEFLEAAFVGRSLRAS